MLNIKVNKLYTLLAVTVGLIYQPLFLIFLSSPVYAGDAPSLMSKYRFRVTRERVKYRNSGMPQDSRFSQADGAWIRAGDKEERLSGGRITEFPPNAQIEIRCVLPPVGKLRKLIRFWDRLDDEIVINHDSWINQYSVYGNLSDICDNFHKKPIASGKQEYRCNQFLYDFRLKEKLYPILISPRYTHVLIPQPKVVWMPVRNAVAYRLNLYEISVSAGAPDELFWSKLVTSSELQQDKSFGVEALSFTYEKGRLKTDRSYEFRIEAIVLDDKIEVTSDEEVDMWGDQAFQECFESNNGVSQTRFRYSPMTNQEYKGFKQWLSRTDMSQQDKLLEAAEYFSAEGFHSQAINLYQKYAVKSPPTLDDLETMAWLYSQAKLIVPACISYRDLYYKSVENPSLIAYTEAAVSGLDTLLGEHWLYQLEADACKF